VNLRARLALSFAALAALAVIAAGTLGWYQSRSELYNQVDNSLYNAAQQAASRIDGPGQANPSAGPLVPPQSDAPNLQLYVTQRTNAQGVIVSPGSPSLPVTEQDLSLATSKDPGIIELRALVLKDGQQLRIASVSLQGGGILQIASSTEGIQSALSALIGRSLILGTLIVFLAALLGAALAATITRPLQRLTKSAEQVALGTLQALPSIDRQDEIGRLSKVLSEMLSALQSSEQSQRRLIEDAGHELRTPLTSITSNLSLLGRLAELEPQVRFQLIADLESEAQEMNDIVSQLVALTGLGKDQPVQDVDINQLCQLAAQKLLRREGRSVIISGQAGIIQGQPQALSHALFNLLENAAKFDSQGQIQIILDPDSVTVLDQGPGIPEGIEEDIFGRFHRAPQARNYPGSGLGLAIVQEVALQHGGQTFAYTRPEGSGAAVGFSWNS